MNKVLIIMFLLVSNIASGTDYYLKNGGNDVLAGTSDATAWATITKVNSMTFSPGDRIFFKRGCTFRGHLGFSSSGTASSAFGIYCMGNSLTYNGYPGLLQTALGSTFKVEDRGVGGNFTSDMVSRFETDVTNNNNVKYVIIEGGTNDISQWFTALSIEANLQKMYTAAKIDSEIVIAMTIPPIGSVGWGQDSTRQAILAEVNNWIRSKPTDVNYVIDIFTAMEDPAHPTKLRPEDTSDGLHFTIAGKQRELNAILASVQFSCDTTNHITIGAYGTGPKPKLINALDKSSTSDWTDLGGNIWRTATTIGSTWKDCGNLIFNNEEILGVKKTSLSACIEQGNWNVEEATDYVYLYSVSNPGTFYSHIEIGGTLYQECILLNNKDFIIVENLDLRYAGNNGIILQNGCDNVIVQNNDISYVGGLYWLGPTDGRRMGNGVQMWETTSNVTIRYNYIHDIYDAGISPQGTTAGTSYKNINIYQNIIANCYYSYEMWVNSDQSVGNINFINNTCYNAGGTWSANIRPDQGNARHLMLWNLFGPVEGFNVSNNIFKDCSGAAIRVGNGVAKLNSDFNVWDVSTMASANGPRYTSLTEWSAGTGHDIHSLSGDPLFVSTTNYHLRPGSSAISNGKVLNLFHDYDGIIIDPTDPDIGAFEFISSYNQAPSIMDQTFQIAKHSSNGTLVGTIEATDPDEGQKLYYSIVSGNTDGVFTINDTTGMLSVSNSSSLDINFKLVIKVQDNGFDELSSQATITINIILTENDKTIEVYPNPVSGELTIEILGYKDTPAFEILNSIGQIVFKGNLSVKTVVPTTNLTSGVYLIIIEDNKSFVSKKFLKI